VKRRIGRDDDIERFLKEVTDGLVVHYEDGPLAYRRPGTIRSREGITQMIRKREFAR
jgi:hypothetical protein